MDRGRFDSNLASVLPLPRPSGMRLCSLSHGGGTSMSHPWDLVALVICFGQWDIGSKIARLLLGPHGVLWAFLF